MTKLQKNKVVLPLKNSKKVTLIGHDDWSRKLFKLKNEVFVLVDKTLYTKTKDGEPDCPLKEEYQFDIPILTEREYLKKHPDYRGVFEDFQGLNPELIGTRTMLLPNCGGLGFDGIHFLII